MPPVLYFKHHMAQFLIFQLSAMYATSSQSPNKLPTYLIFPSTRDVLTPPNPLALARTVLTFCLSRVVA